MFLAALGFFIWLSSFSIAPQSVYEGVVIDSSNKAIAGVEVTVVMSSGREFSGFTDVQGKYAIEAAHEELQSVVAVKDNIKFNYKPTNPTSLIGHDFVAVSVKEE